METHSQKSTFKITKINPKTIKMLIKLIKPLTKSTLKYNASLKVIEQR